MRIVHLAAGAANMYCGACARDAALARALIARGHEVRIVPLYTPLRVEGDPPLPLTDVHLGAMNAYLQQLHGGFARLPRSIARLLDHPGLLRWLSRFAVSTRPSQLGPMTVSVLAGADGRQRAELARLLDFLAEQPRPDAVTITNSMLSGIAPDVKRRLGVPVICEVKGEDGFIDAIPDPHRSQAIGLLRRNAASIDRFVAPSESYAEHMAQYVGVPRERVTVVRSGIDAQASRREGPRHREPFTIGYLSVITPRKGLHVLVAAFERLVSEGHDARLRVAGQVLDRGYFRDIERRVRRARLQDRVEFLGELDLDEKIALLHSLSALCQPSIKPEVLGTVALEAQAAGLPVIAPDEGAFPEMLELTRGGVLFAPGDADDLAARLAQMADDPDGADAMGERGAAAVARHCTAEAAAEATIALLEGIGGAGTQIGGDFGGEEAV